MSSLILDCKNSITFTNNSNYCKISNNLCVGNINSNIFSIYLYFDTTSIPNNIELISASLVLFKLPTKNICSGTNNNIYKSPNYNIAPTSKYLSKYSNEYRPKSIYQNLIYHFQTPYSFSSLEVDIKNFVELWITDKIENKGLLLYPNKDSKFVMFGSKSSDDEGLCPFLIIRYKDNNCIYINDYTPIIELPIKIDIL